MRILLSVFLLVSCLSFFSAQTISFESEDIDYGVIKKGSPGNREFIAMNKGDKPLIISEVKPSCGCTVSDWEKKPILPGKTTKIKISYNTNIVGSFNKLIEVFSNDPEKSRYIVRIKGEVK